MCEEKVYDCGWSLATSCEDTIRDNARDLDHGKKRRKYTDAKGDIKAKVWDDINRSIMAFEDSYRDMFAEAFRVKWVRDEGHNSFGELVGSCGLTRRAIFDILDRSETYDAEEFVVLTNGRQPEGVSKYAELLHPCVDVSNITFWVDKEDGEALTEEYEVKRERAYEVAKKLQRKINMWWGDVPSDMTACLLRDTLMEEVKEFYAD